MKKCFVPRWGFGGVVSLGLFLASPTFGQLAVQEDSATPAATNAEDVSKLSDFEVELQAIESTAPVPYAQVTQTSGNFYSAQHAADWPPLPGNVLSLDVWPLGDGVFILNDTNVNYAALQAMAVTSPVVTKSTSKALKAASNKSLSSGSSPMMMSAIYAPTSGGCGCVTGGQVYITNFTATLNADDTVTVSFCIEGGSKNVAYDIFSTTNLTIIITNNAQWNWLGQGYTCNTYTFTNQPDDLLFYALAIPQQTMVVAWGDNSAGQCNVPVNLTNAIAVDGGYNFSLALRSDGTVTAWGDNTYGQTNVPAGLSNVVSIAAGAYHAVAVKADGTLAQWGYYLPDDFISGSNPTPVGTAPTNANIVAVAAGTAHDLAVKADGTVLQWGLTNANGLKNFPANLTGVIAVGAGFERSLALLTNGSIVDWGYFVPIFGQDQRVPADLTNAAGALAAGPRHDLAVRTNNTVESWGYNMSGQTNVPTGLSNVVAVAGGSMSSLALLTGGTVTAWGDATVPYGLTGVKAIAAGYAHNLALRSGSLTPVIIQPPTNQYGFPGSNVTFSVWAEGVAGLTYQWQFNDVAIPGATNATLTLTNLQASNAGNYRVVINSTAGSITSQEAYLTMPQPPLILSQTPMLTNINLSYGTNFTLSVQATNPNPAGHYPMGYKWQFNSTPVLFANTATSSFTANVSGTYAVLVTNAAGATSAVWQVTVDYTGGAFAPGMLAYHLSTNAVGYASGYSGSASDESPLSGWTYAQYSGTNMALLTNSVWSTNFWLKGVRGLSATCIGISNGVGGQMLLTMVSPRHYLRAHHVGNPPGIIAFLDTNNVVYWRTFLQQVQIGISDTDVGILNADLPSSVGYLPLLPTNYSNYLPTNSGTYVQGIGMNQDIRIFSQPMTFANSDGVYWDPGWLIPFGLGTNWNFTIRSGDSSDPERLLIRNQFVLVSQHTSSGSGPNLVSQFNAINQRMHYLSTNNSAVTDYQLTSFSLTNWPTIH